MDTQTRLCWSLPQNNTGRTRRLPYSEVTNLRSRPRPCLFVPQFWFHCLKLKYNCEVMSESVAQSDETTARPNYNSQGREVRVYLLHPPCMNPRDPLTRCPTLPTSPYLSLCQNRPQYLRTHITSSSTGSTTLAARIPLGTRRWFRATNPIQGLPVARVTKWRRVTLSPSARPRAAS